MRFFSSYGPVDPEQHYYAPRTELIARTYKQLLGNNPNKGGHYITVWGPRQTGKSWVMQQILFRLQDNPKFDTLKINLENLKNEKDSLQVINEIAREIRERLGKTFSPFKNSNSFENIFKNGELEKPLVLILDEFDSLPEEAIGMLVSTFRNIYNSRTDEIKKNTGEKLFLLHGVALIGVRSVLGIGQDKGSPFNVQRSVKIPNLTFEEVQGMFEQYRKETGQSIEEEVIARLYRETRGQPGITCWFGELLTEKYNENKDQPITMKQFERVYKLAVSALPNTNILNIISKAKQAPYKDKVLELFRAEGIAFHFDDEEHNFLYMHGVIDYDEIEGDEIEMITRFANPFLQRRLFNYFSIDIFDEMGRLVDPFDTLEDAVTEKELHIPNIINRYKGYLERNKNWLFQGAPRRRDMRIYEAVFHFNIYMYLFQLLKKRGCRVYPEFPTGNGHIDLLLEYKNKTYGIELKSYSTHDNYLDALRQAAHYGKKLKLKEIFLLFFIEAIDDKNREKYEQAYFDKINGVKVLPLFAAIETKK